MTREHGPEPRESVERVGEGRAREWLKQHSKQIALSAALVFGGAGVGAVATEKFMEGASEDRIGKIIAADKNLKKTQVTGERYEVSHDGEELSVTANIDLGANAETSVVAVMDSKGRLKSLTLWGQSQRGTAQVVEVPVGPKLHVSESHQEPDLKGDGYLPPSTGKKDVNLRIRRAEEGHQEN